MHWSIDIDNVENVAGKRARVGEKEGKKRRERDINLRVVNRARAAAVASELSPSPLWKHHQH